MTKISFVYFDVGGVAIKDFSDTPKWDIMISQLGLDKYDRSQVDLVYSIRDNDICLGKIHVDELVPLYNTQFDANRSTIFASQLFY